MSRARHSRRSALRSSTMARCTAPSTIGEARRAPVGSHPRPADQPRYDVATASPWRTMTSSPSPKIPTMTLADARALWWHKQALADGDSRPLATALASAGWLRTLGGADVYIASRARRPRDRQDATRAELDAAVSAGELRVQPAVRGCIYLVPSSAVPDLLALNAEAWRALTEKELAKIGKTLAVVETLVPAVLATLTEPRTPDGIRKAFRGEIPSFGDAGKKVGLSSPP